MRNVDEITRLIYPYRLYSTLHTVAAPEGTRFVASHVASFAFGERRLEGHSHLARMLEGRSERVGQLDPWTTKARGEILVDGERRPQAMPTTVLSRDRSTRLIDGAPTELTRTSQEAQALRGNTTEPWGIQLAPEQQRLPQGHFEGGEWIELAHPDRGPQSFQLPELRARSFARRAGTWEEVPTELDTVILFPDEQRGAMIWRGLGPAADAGNVDALITGIEPLGDPRPAAYYHELAGRHRSGRTPVVLHDGELLPEATMPCATCRHRVGRTGWHCDRVSLVELRREGHPVDEANPPPVDRMGCRYHEPRDEPRTGTPATKPQSPTPALAETSPAAPTSAPSGTPAQHGGAPSAGASPGVPAVSPPGPTAPGTASSPLTSSSPENPPPTTEPKTFRDGARTDVPKLATRLRRGMRDKLRITLHTDAFDAAITDVHTVNGRECVSQLPEWVVQAVHKSDVPLDLDAIVGQPMAVRIATGDEELRTVYGLVRDIESLHDTEERHTTYRMTVVPRAFKMTLEQRQEIHLNRSVPDIIRHKLRQSGLVDEGEDFEMRLHGDYPVREFVVQYRESDLAFVSRLAEHVGISFFFEHSDGRDRMVFVDHTDGFPTIDEDPRVSYHRRGEEVGCYHLYSKRRLIPRNYVVRDYNYRTPSLELMNTHELEKGDSGSVVEWGGHFKTPAEGAALAALRAQESESSRLVHEGVSDEPLLRAGALFDLEGHPHVEGRLLLTEVEVKIEQAVATGLGRGDERTYENRFKAVDAGLHYRPPRVTPVPRIHSVISGYVQADHLGDIQKFAKIDDMGRYHVRFMFDHAAGEESFCSHPIRRAQPMVGPNYGLHFPLRPGMEVLMVFVDGDPDRPIIIGAVHHPVTPNPIARQDQTKNRLKTESGVLFEIEDGAGS